MTVVGTLLGRDGDTAAADTTPTEIATILSNERRQAVIKQVATADSEPVSLDSLAVAIARREVGGEPDSHERKRVYISLYQNHLETLDDAGVIDYDKRAAHVSHGSDFEAFNGAREALAEHSGGSR